MHMDSERERCVPTFIAITPRIRRDIEFATRA